jgi:hypothetical protein
LNVPQSRLTVKGAPSTFSPVSGICVSVFCADAWTAQSIVPPSAAASVYWTIFFMVSSR